ncbi:hypothetical protein CSUI_008222 [Cystoisospora suis]|uniref:Uncharacterized protein n=1 Tax=Cystoisospora suis TaxID=483139 RepID=A0A2C6KNA8_9APIC|nr:hypothetical protein CSUI_008222 [Cystoisospora suis]
MTSSSGMHSSSLSSDQRVRRKEESQKEKEEEEEEEGEGEQETGQEGGRKEEVHGEKTKDGEDEERKNVKQVAVSLYLLKHPSPFFPLAEYSHPLSDQYEEDTLVTPSSSSFPSSSLKERREKKGLSPGKIDLEPKARAGFEEEEEKEDDDLDADILSILEKNGWGSKTPDSRRKMLLSSTSSSFFSSPSPSPSPAALILLPSPRSSSSAPPLSSSSRIETAGTFSSPPHPEFSPSPSSSSTFVSPSSSRDQRKKKAATSSSLSLPREEDPNGKRRRRRREEAEEKEQEKNGDSKRPRSKRVDSTSLRSFPGVASHMKAPASSSSSSFSSSYQNVPFRDSSTNTGGALPALQERREGESSRNLAKRKKKKNGNMAAMGEKKQGEEEEGEGEQQPVKRKRVRYRRSRVGSRRRMSLPPPSREILDATHTKQKDKKRRHVLESLESEVIRKKEDEKDLLYKGKEEEEEKEQVPPSLHRDRQRGSLKQKTPPYRHLLSSLERPPDEGDKEEEANYSSSSSSSLALLDEVVKKMKEKEEETSLSSPLKEEKKSVENPEKRAKTGDEEDQVEKKKEEEMRELMHKKNEEGDDDEEEKKRQRLLHREERRGKEEGKEGRKLGGQEEEEEVQVKEEGEDKRTSSATHPPAVRLSASSLSSSRPASSFSFSFSVYEDDPNVNTPRAAFSSDLPPRHGGRKSPFPLLSHSLLRPSSSSLLPLSRGGLPRVSNDQKKFLLPAVEAALEERGGREFRQDRDFLYLPKYEEKSFTPSTSTFASSSLSSLSTTGQHYDPFLSSSSWLDPPSVSPLSLSRSQLDERRRRRRVPLRAVSPSPFYHSSSSSPYLSFALVFITSSILLYSARQMTQSSSPSLSHFFPGQKGDLLGDIFNSLLLEQRQKQRKRAMKTMRRPPSVNSQTNHHPVEPTKDSKDNSSSSSSLARIPPPLSLSPSSLFPSSSSLLDSNLSPSLLSAFSSSPSPSKPQSSSFSGFFFGEDFSEWTSLGMQGDQERLLRAHLSSGSNRRRRRRAATTSLLTGEGGGDLQEDDARRLLSSTVFPSFFLPKNEALIEADREETPLGEVAEFLKYDLRRLARLPSFLRRFPPEEKYEIREYLDSYTRLLSSSASSPLEELRGTGLKEEEGEEEEGEKKEIFSPEKRGYQFWNRVLQGYGLREYFNTKYRQKMKDLSSSLSSLSSSSSSLSASTVDGMTPSSSSSKKGPFTKSELDHQVERVRAKYHLASIHWYTYKLIQADLVEYLDQLAASAASASSSSSSFPSSDDDSERKGPVGEGDNVSSSSLPLQNKSKSGSAPLPSSDSQVYIQHFGKFAVPAEVSKNMISYLTFQVELLRHKALQAKHFLTILKLHRQLQNSRSSETPANSAAPSPSSSSAASPSLAEKEAEGFFADTKERGRGGIGSKEDDDSFMYLTPSQRNKILLKKKFYQEQMQNSTNLIKVHESIVKSLRKELKMSFFRHGAGLRFTPTTAAGRKDEGGGKGNMRLFEYHALTW